MRNDVSRDLRAATILSAFGFDPNMVMRQLEERSRAGALNGLHDDFEAASDYMGRRVLARLLRNGQATSLLMPRPGRRSRVSGRGYSRDTLGDFNPSQFPKGSFARELANFAQNNPFGRQQLEMALGGRIVPSSVGDGSFSIQPFGAGMFGGGNNINAALAYSMLDGIQRGAASVQQAFNNGNQVRNPYQSILAGTFGQWLDRNAQNRAQAVQAGGGVPVFAGGPGAAQGQAMTGLLGALAGLGGNGGNFGGGNFGGGFNGINGGTGVPSATQGAFGLGSTGGLGGAILGDGSLTVEDKVTLLIMQIMKKMDQDILRQANYVNSLQQQQNAGGGQGGGGAPSIDVETMKLKRLIDKRSQMFDMLRQIIDKYNQTAKGIIDSMGR